MSIETTLKALRSEGANHDDIRGLKDIALEAAFAMLSESQQDEIRALVVKDQNETWEHREAINAANRRVVA